MKLELENVEKLNEKHYTITFIEFGRKLKSDIVFAQNKIIFAGQFNFTLNAGSVEQNGKIRLAELLTEYDYFYGKILDYIPKHYDSKATKQNILDYLKRLWKDHPSKSFFETTWEDFDFSNEYLTLYEVIDFLKDNFDSNFLNIRSIVDTALDLIERDSNYDSYRHLFELLRQFVRRIITKEEIQAYQQQEAEN